MRILHLANTPLSNAPANLASCQNYMGHEAKLLLAHKVGRNKVFVGGDIWGNKNLEQLTAIFEWAEIIHFHNFTWNQEIFLKHPSLLDIAKSKKYVVQFHSSRHAHEDFESTLKDDLFKNKKLVIAQYQVREYPECEWIVPNPLPLHEDRYRLTKRGKWGDMSPLCVSYAPSNAHLKGWDYKGYDQINPALTTMGRCGISIDLIFGASYEDCLARKAYAHIGIEEFFTGSYHLSLLEYMALECATFGHMDFRTREALASIVGIDALIAMPVINVETVADLMNRMRELKQNPELIRVTAEASKKWIFDNWSPEKLMPKFDIIYESI